MAKYKPGDKVRVRNDLKVGELYGIMYFTLNMSDARGRVLTIERVEAHSYGVEEDYPSYWTDEMFEGLAEEAPKSEPIPTPVVNVNVTVNLYENACWYCRKGGVVDLYLAGAMGICPSCGRVCNNTLPTKPKKESIVIEFKHKENRPLTNEEFQALPVGTKVFIVWRWDMKKNCKGKPNWVLSDWGVKEETMCYWGSNNKHNQGNKDYDRCFDAYLEEPERPF